MKKILLIDDDDMLRMMGRRLLERAGYEVRAASCGKEGLALAEQEPFDAVVCDFEMPSMTGLVVWDRLPTNLQRRFLLWTGAPDRVAQVAVKVLAKPSSSEVLIQAIQEILSEDFHETPS